MQLHPNEIHVWSSELTITAEQESELYPLLDGLEQKRAEHFRFRVHTTRFIATRATLRKILGIYLSLEPKEIEFNYTEHNKPFLKNANCEIHFNIAHSNDLAVYAFTLKYEVGIDIEKIQPTYNESVAKRFFSEEENAALLKLSHEEKRLAFYRIWARKEAVVKAQGQGISYGLTKFSVSPYDEVKTIFLDNQKWMLVPLSIHTEYQSAVASNQAISSISFWSFFEHQPKLNHIKKL